jgi:chromosome partitioning protein
MKVIAILNQKGGCGKTTIATNIAHAFSLDGKKILLVDSDPQGSARDWNEENGGNLFPVVGLDRETLPKDLDGIKGSYDYIIIDGAPQIAKLAAAAVKSANLVLIPCQPSPYDVWATADLVDIIKARQEVTEGLPKAAFLISRAIKNSKLEKEVKLALESYNIPIFNSFTTQRVVYPSAASEGKTVFAEVNNAAANEIQCIKKEIMEFMQWG